MPNKLTIVLSGRKQSGKTSTSNYILAKYLNLKPGYCRFLINETGELCGAYPYINGLTSECAKYKYISDNGAKIYSFADPLKRFIIDILNVPEESCYGTDAQKNAPVPHILWENFPQECRPIAKKHHDSNLQEFSGIAAMEPWTEYVLATGPMTGREIMQYLGTNIVRKIYGDCWACGTYNAIKNEGFTLAVISDCRFKNEVELGTEVNAKTVRLLRDVFHDSHPSETALDDYPLNKYSVVVDNRNMTLEEQCRYMDPIIDQWFKEAGIS